MTEKKEDKSKSLTIFEVDFEKERKAAINNLLHGRTPEKEKREREGRGGTVLTYVNGYYMFHQASLITGFRWSSECIEERAYPNWDNPREIGARMKVSLWDREGNSYTHTSWGQKDVARFRNASTGHKVNDPISIFDDLKAAYTDGIKKCLSYFGIANDVYGSKEFEFDEEDTSTVEVTSSDMVKALSKYVESSNIRWSEAFKILGISTMSEITDYRAAYKILKSALEQKGGEQPIIQEEQKTTADQN